MPVEEKSETRSPHVIGAEILADLDADPDVSVTADGLTALTAGYIDAELSLHQTVDCVKFANGSVVTVTPGDEEKLAELAFAAESATDEMVEPPAWQISAEGEIGRLVRHSLRVIRAILICMKCVETVPNNPLQISGTSIGMIHSLDADRDLVRTGFRILEGSVDPQIFILSMSRRTETANIHNNETIRAENVAVGLQAFMNDVTTMNISRIRLSDGTTWTPDTQLERFVAVE